MVSFTVASSSASTGSRLLFWLQALVSALSDKRVVFGRGALLFKQAADHARFVRCQRSIH